MNCWLLKSDPDDYSFDDLLRDGTTRWDGVSNPQALIHLRTIARGDRLLIYHTGAGKAVVGLASVSKGPYTDPAGDDARRVVIDIKAGQRLPRPVLLAQVKGDPRFADFPLVRMPRLSVMPVPGPIWNALLELAGVAK